MVDSAQPQVAVIGGGLAGLSAASRLAALGVSCTVFDMGTRNLGGRACSRVMQDQGVSFDHGAQFLRATTDAFEARLQSWVTAGIAAPWQGVFGVLDPETFRVREPTALEAASSFCGFFRGDEAMRTPIVGAPSMGAVAVSLQERLMESSNGASKVLQGHKVSIECSRRNAGKSKILKPLTWSAF